MAKKQKRPHGVVRKTVMTVLSAILAIALIGLLYLAYTLLPPNARMVNLVLGEHRQSVDNSAVDTDGLDLDYYQADYDNADELAAARVDLRTSLVDEGTILLKNDGAMPFSTDTTFSFFGAASNSGGTGGNPLGALFGGAELSSLKDGFEEAGFGVNDQLWDFYGEGPGADCGLGAGSVGYGDAEDFSINECPIDELLATDGLEASFQGTVPVYVMSRVAGEGRDMPRSMVQHTDVPEDQVKSYLEPNSVELELMQYLNDNFPEVVLLVDATAALDLGWVDQFDNLDAVVYAPSADGRIAHIFSGDVNPSGRTVDTFAVDALRSPAAQNVGSYTYSDENGELTKYNYVSYKEGIYVGYRYYETRYEDAVSGQGNAGDYVYDDQVVYPFGYGLSYTTFTWGGLAIDTSDDDNWTATVEVTNDGDVAGRDVVGIYLQKPYSDYDRANGIEQASAELVGYAKTDTIEPGDTQSVVATIDPESLKTYDANGAGTYIVEPGEYLFTAGTDAHAAVNNLLAFKGYGVEDGMTADGDAALVAGYTPGISAIDSTTYAVDSTTGAPVSNQFDDASGDLEYLSRADWVGTWPTHDGTPSTEISTWGNEINGTDESGNPASFTWTKTISDEGLAALDSTDSGNPVDASTITADLVYGADNGLSVADMRGLDFDDPQWDDLLDQLEPEDYQTLIGVAGYGTPAIESVGKPYNLDIDAASGLIGGGPAMSLGQPMLLAQTWNRDLALDYGTFVGNNALLGSVQGWYAPSMNIHRTPFSGRNGEYYSEDPYISSVNASQTVYGAASKGLYTFIKHFAFNDQENHRGDRDGQFGLATWGNEQSLREIYLAPFESAIKAGEVEVKYVARADDGSLTNEVTTVRASQGVMSAFNRIGYTWTGGSYALLTGVLRDEWGFNGFVITDNANTGVFMDAYQMIEAGGDAKLTALPASARWTFDPDNAAEYVYGRNAIHHILYTTVNSLAYDGTAPGSVVKDGLQITGTILLVITVVSGALLVLLAYFTWRRFWGPRNRRIAPAADSTE